MMRIGRRDSLHLFGGALLAAIAAPASGKAASARSVPARGPRMLEVRKGAATVTILGFGEARDDGWFSPSVRAAFDASSQLWLETVPPDMARPLDPASTKRIEELSHTVGQSFYECLAPDVSIKAKERVANLAISEKDIDSLRPWRAYNVIVSAYYRRHPAEETKYVDEFLAKKAAAEGKTIGFEFPSYLNFVEFMAALSPSVQSQYISWLLTYLDEQDRGLNEKRPYDWAIGRGPAMTRSLERMIAMPDLYSAVQSRRNQWWANKIIELLDGGGHAFIGIGYLHVIGPAGIPEQLRRLGQPVDMI